MTEDVFYKNDFYKVKNKIYINKKFIICVHNYKSKKKINEIKNCIKSILIYQSDSIIIMGIVLIALNLHNSVFGEHAIFFY